jgi:hypothetical protein
LIFFRESSLLCSLRFVPHLIAHQIKDMPNGTMGRTETSNSFDRADWQETGEWDVDNFTREWANTPGGEHMGTDIVNNRSCCRENKSVMKKSVAGSSLNQQGCECQKGRSSSSHIPPVPIRWIEIFASLRTGWIA